LHEDRRQGGQAEHRQAGQQHRAAAVTVGDRAQHRAGEKLHNSESGQHHPDPERGLGHWHMADLFDQIRHHGDHDGEGQRVEKHGDEDEGDGGLSFLHGGRARV
jgi:hypothetical protein